MTLNWTVVHGSPEWHEFRARNIGSSEVAGLFGVQAGFAASAFTLHQVKSGLIEPLPVDDRPGTRVWRGKRLEPVIASMAAEQFGWRIRYPGPYALDDECEGMAASLDGWIEEPGEEEKRLGFTGPGNLEVKEASWLAHKRDWSANEPPFQIVLQNQQGCACSGARWGVVVVDVGEIGLLPYRYAARPQTAALIRREIAAFWSRVREGRSPDPDATSSTAAALKVMFPSQVDSPTLDLLEDDQADVTAAAFLIAGANRAESERVYVGQRSMLMWKLRGVTQAETANHWINANTDKRGTVRLRVVEKQRT